MHKSVEMLAELGKRSFFFSLQCHHMSSQTSWAFLPAVAEVKPTSEVGTPSRRGYVVPMRMMVKREVNLRCQGTLNV